MSLTNMTPPESEQELAFERCADFLARMIIKYGGDLDLPEIERSREAAAGAETWKEYRPAA